MQKTIYIFFFVIVLLTNNFAQSLQGVKLCIDPGHGGHDPANDRHILPPDFWESEGNFGKALHLKELLLELGAEVFITRTGNDDSDDIALSARAAIANANNVDYFHSIHSNATGTSNRANFPLILFRGYDNSPVFPQAKTFAAIVWQKIYDAKSGVWSYNGMNIRGDWSFYPDWGTSGLGVLRPLTMPGTLSEGSFHDYIPEAWRLKNDFYLHHEAHAIARAFLQHFNGGTYSTGIVAGIVRDPDKQVPSSYQPLSATQDKYQPVNYLVVTLQPGNHVYFGDDQNNGYYFFDNLEPGQYTVYITEDFHESDTAQVTVQANKSSFYDSFIREIPNYSAPNIIQTTPSDSQVDVGTRDTIKIDFDLRMNRSSTQAAFSILPNVQGEFIWLNQDKTLAYFPLVPYDQETEYTVTINNTAKTVYESALTSEFSFKFTTGVATAANAVSHFPEDNAINVSNMTGIEIEFDTRMNDITTQNAFSITPSVSGTFSWNNDYTIMKFLPNTSYVAGETYTVSVGTTARTYYGGYLAAEISFNFTTRSKLNVVNYYPMQDAEDISTTVLVKIFFEMPIYSGSLPGNILFYDPDDQFVSVKVNQQAYSKGIIEFEPSQELIPLTVYRVILKEGIRDIENVPFGEELVISFTTSDIQTNLPQISIDDFELLQTWNSIADSDSSRGFDETNTTFSIATAKKISGSSSGKLSYSFTANGLLELKNSTLYELGSDAATEFGMWIFGDLSYNIIEFWFVNSQSEIIQFTVDTLNWTGWKFKSLTLGDLNALGDIGWGSIATRQNENGEAEGTIYFDNVVSDFVTAVSNDDEQIVNEYRLFQNYPNPFNPTTKIKYSIPGSGSGAVVTLKIYDILGRELKTLINKPLSAGNYEIEFDGSYLPSGVYIYRLNAGGFISSKKMLMIK